MRKTLQELTIKHNFLFGAVMLDEENCKGLLELVLGIEVEHIEVSTEKSIVYHPEYHGVRLDVYAKDENNTRYNIEMQATTSATELRGRYYHSQMDMELLLAGAEYEELPESYVIFICDFDPLGLGKYKYTIDSYCVEAPQISYKDGVHTILINTLGNNKEDVSSALVKFCEFVHASLDDENKDYKDPYVSRLQECIKRIKMDREMGAKYMGFDLEMKREREEGREEGREAVLFTVITQLLSEGASDERIMQLTSCTQLELDRMKKGM